MLHRSIGNEKGLSMSGMEPINNNQSGQGWVFFGLVPKLKEAGFRCQSSYSCQCKDWSDPPEIKMERTRTRTRTRTRPRTQTRARTRKLTRTRTRSRIYDLGCGVADLMPSRINQFSSVFIRSFLRKALRTFSIGRLFPLWWRHWLMTITMYNSR